MAASTTPLLSEPFRAGEDASVVTPIIAAMGIGPNDVVVVIPHNNEIRLMRV